MFFFWIFSHKFFASGADLLTHIFLVVTRYEVTGLTEEHLRNAMPLKEVQEKILQILYNGESIGRIRVLSDGGKARLLVGHNIEHDLDCLRMNYPNHLLRYKRVYLLKLHKL